MFMTPQACLEAGTEYPRYKLFVGFDVGKRFHAAHARTGSGRRVLALRVDNDEAAVDAFVARALEAAGCEPGACLVVVDQRRNIGTVVVRRAWPPAATSPTSRARGRRGRASSSPGSPRTTPRTPR